MQKKRPTRETYKVPKGEEHLVHYLAERVYFDGRTGERESHPDLLKTEVRLFDTIVKKNLELQGYEITILHHPLGKYPEVAEIETPMEEKEREISEKDVQIEELQKKLEEAKKALEDAKGKHDAKAKKELKK